MELDAEARPPADQLETLEALGLERIRVYIDADAEVHEALPPSEQWLRAAVASFVHELPRPPSARAFFEPPFYRPPGAHRSFYFWPQSANVTDGRASGVVAIKGLEPLAPDFAEVLPAFRRSGYSPHTIVEHLIFEERKIPGCVELTEALREAERSADILHRHLTAYGQLARFPLPIAIYRHSEDVTHIVLDQLRENVSTAAFDVVAPRALEGLGVFLFYYPTPPVRVTDLDSLLAGLPFHTRMFALVGLCDPEQVIRRWVRNFVRMLYLDVVPGSLASLRTGICCQPQNACIDGGFVDLDSLTPLSDLIDDAAIYGALQLSLEALLRTVQTLVSANDRVQDDRRRVRIEEHQLTRYVLALIDEALERERREGLSLHPAVERYLASPASLEEVVDSIAAAHPRPDPAFVARAREFSTWTSSLIRATQDHWGAASPERPAKPS